MELGEVVVYNWHEITGMLGVQSEQRVLGDMVHENYAKENPRGDRLKDNGWTYKHDGE